MMALECMTTGSRSLRRTAVQNRYRDLFLPLDYKRLKAPLLFGSFWLQKEQCAAYGQPRSEQSLLGVFGQPSRTTADPDAGKIMIGHWPMFHVKH